MTGIANTDEDKGLNILAVAMCDQRLQFYHRWRKKNREIANIQIADGDFTKWKEWKQFAATMKLVPQDFVPVPALEFATQQKAVGDEHKGNDEQQDKDKEQQIQSMIQFKFMRNLSICV